MITRKKKLTQTRLPSKKPTKVSLLKSWGLPATFQWNHLRYKNPYQKGVYWYFFSRFVRERDIAKYGVCITCGKPITMENCDAGHFMSADKCGRDLLFDPRNVNAECKSCNGFDPNHLLPYARNLDKRYGEGTAAYLEALKDAYHFGGTQKDWSAQEYEEKIRALRG